MDQRLDSDEETVDTWLIYAICVSIGAVRYLFAALPSFTFMESHSL